MIVSVEVQPAVSVTVKIYVVVESGVKRGLRMVVELKKVAGAQE